jgi:cell division septal protein FtsQ
LVRSVKVRRQLPDTLVIDVIERTALARLDDSGRGLPLAVDAEGYVLGPSSYSPSLAVIRGVRQDGLRPGTHLRADAVRDALEVLDICDTTRISQFINIHLIDVGRADYLDVRLTTGERVLLKRENLDWRLRQVAAILQTSDEPGKRIAIIDGTGDDIFPVEYR